MRTGSEVPPAAVLDGARTELLGVVNAIATLLRRETGSVLLQLVGPAGGEGTSTIAANLARAVQDELGERCCVLVAGASGSEAAPGSHALTDAERHAVLAGDLAAIVQRLANTCRVFLIDSPAVQAGPLATALAGQVGGTVLVIDAGRTTGAEAQQAIDEIERAKGHVLGVVINKRRFSVPRPLARLLGMPTAPRHVVSA